MERSASVIHFTDFPNICRICLFPGDLKPFKESNVYSLFTNMLGNIRTEMEDKLPENICKNCLNVLQNISRFISKYKTSESILRSIINQKMGKNLSVKANNIENCRVDVYVRIEKYEINHSTNNFKEVKETYNNELKVVKNRNSGPKIDTRSNELCDSNKTQSDLNLHLKRCHKQKIKSEQKNKWKVVNRAGSFLCNICGKNFTRKSSLKIHIKIHAGEKNFECHICGFKFILKCTLQRHLAVHRNEKKFQCDICLKVLSQKAYLIRHIETFHGTVKEKCVEKKEAPSYFCPVCDKGFLFKKSLDRHKNTHKTRSFLCTHCGKLFTFKCNLDRHILITHSGEKPFECTICGDRFTCKTSLNCHLNIHNGIKPYQCASCQKCFRQPSSLRKHLLVHTGERRFKCHICEMAFKTGTHLKTHFKKHSRS